jgi:transposase-like protein
MTCLRCQDGTAKRFGTYGRLRIQRFRRKSCKATFTQPHQRPLGRHYIQTEKAVQVITLLTEPTGNPTTKSAEDFRKRGLQPNGITMHNTFRS